MIQTKFSIYIASSSEPVKKLALERGYLSPWLIRRFKAILAREEKRHRDYQLAVKQEAVTPTKVRSSR